MKTATPSAAENAAEKPIANSASPAPAVQTPGTDTPGDPASTPAPPQADAEAKAKAAKRENIAPAMVRARGVLAACLQLLIKGRVLESDPNRLALENAFEAVRAEIEARQETGATLIAAADHAKVAVTILANNSATRPDELLALKGEVNLLRKLTEALKEN